MAFNGSCHCGKLAYTVDEDPPTRAMQCNCSICRRRGALHHFTTPDKFSFEGANGDVGTYKWNKEAIAFEFCETCGCAPFAHGTGPNGPMVEINLRCAEGIDLDQLEISHFDGAHKLPGPDQR
ncbi:MAG: GFA family protein [Allosphingosinicella sp.]